MKHNYFIVVLFSIIMSTLLVSCDDKNAQDPFAGIEVQKGVQELPYSTSEFLSLVKMTTDRLHPLNSTETKHWRNIWFQGYIVGCYDATSIDTVQLTAPYSTNKTVLVAQTPNETDRAKMVLVTVTIPYWESQLGLEATNGASKNRLAKFWVDVISPENQQDPFMAESTNLRGFWWTKENSGLIVNLEPYISEDFSSNIGSYTNYFQEQRATSYAIWKTAIYAGAGKCAQAIGSAYISGTSDSVPPSTDQSWLVSKAIQLPDYEFATLSFKIKPLYVVPLYSQKGDYNPAEELMLFVAELTESETFVSPLTASGRFVQIPLTGYPAAPMEVAMTKDFTSYAGKKIQLAFKYKSVRWYKMSGVGKPQNWSVTNVDLR